MYYCCSLLTKVEVSEMVQGLRAIKWYEFHILIFHMLATRVSEFSTDSFYTEVSVSETFLRNLKFK